LTRSKTTRPRISRVRRMPAMTTIRSQDEVRVSTGLSCLIRLASGAAVVGSDRVETRFVDV